MELERLYAELDRALEEGNEAKANNIARRIAQLEM